MDKDRAIELLQDKIDRIDGLESEKSDTSANFIKWKKSTQICIQKIFNNPKKNSEFDCINFKVKSIEYHGSDGVITNCKFFEGLDKARTVLEIMIYEIENFGIEGSPILLQESNSKKSNLEKLISKKNDIRSLLRRDETLGFDILEGLEFRQWLADIKALVISLKKNELTDSILNLVDGFNGYRDERDFSQLCGELKSLADDFNDYYEEIDMPLKEKSNKVFIVHGHDNALKQEVARFLERLGLEPIILHEQASLGLTVIEKIEEYSDVDFGIVLYTPCDTGCVKGGIPKPRARQNVVFEHGYLIAKLGRRNVCALVSDDSIEKPSDISGVVYVSANNEWKLDVAKELKACGYDIDMNKLQ